MNPGLLSAIIGSGILLAFLLIVEFFLQRAIRNSSKKYKSSNKKTKSEKQ